MVLVLKRKKKIGSLKKLPLKKYFIPLVSSATACGLIGLICGGWYFIYHKNEVAYLSNDTAIRIPISEPRTILGAAYSQCYQSVNSSGYDYHIDSYEYSIQGVGGPDSAQISIGEFGCLLNALNIDKTTSGASVLTTMLQSAKNSTDNNSDVTIIGPYYLYLAITYTNGELIGTEFAVEGHAMNGYKFDTSSFPAISTINTSANFINSVGPALSAVSDVFTPSISPSESDSNGSDSSDSSSNSESNTNPSNQPSTSSDAASAIASDSMCSQEGGKNNMSSNSQATGGNPTSITVYGTTGWGPILSCVAGGTSMPSSVENSLKAFISRDVSALNGGEPIKNPISDSTNWTLGDGSSIYLTYGGPNNGNGGWSATFSTTNPNNN